MGDMTRDGKVATRSRVINNDRSVFPLAGLHCGTGQISE